MQGLTIEAHAAKRVASLHACTQPLAGRTLGLGEAALGVHPQQTGDGLAATGDEDLGALLNPLQVAGEMLVGIANGDDLLSANRTAPSQPLIGYSPGLT